MLSSVKENPDILLMYFLLPSEMVEQSMALMGMSKEKIEIESKKFIKMCCDAISGILKEHNKPLVGFTYRSFRDNFMQELLSRGVPIFPGSERAARAIKALTRYYELREEIVKAGRQRD